MTFPDFAGFFTHCTDHEPYPWQEALAELVRDGHWPDRIDVPTGLGKTSAVLVAAYTAARQVAEGRPRTTPQRIVHVVNRRSVVDQTRDELTRWARRAAEVPEVAEVLRAMAGPWGEGDDAVLLPVQHLHGEANDAHGWMRPAGVVLLTMTPPQLVSRLLMRGLGVRPRSRSLHAGLLGLDTLVLFDEPQLSPQAVATVREAFEIQQRLAAPTEALGVPASRLVLLGATIPDGAAPASRSPHGGVSSPESTGPDGAVPPLPATLTITPRDIRHPGAGRVLKAPKPVRLVMAAHSDTPVTRALAAAYREQRARLGAQARIAVIVNTVALAQEVHRALTVLAVSGEGEGEPLDGAATDVMLLTSRMRPVDRPVLDGAEAPPTIVATQCLEVGLDLSFESIITELAPYPVLQQRLGRLNRHPDQAQAVAEGPLAVVILPKDASKVRAGSEAVYGAEPLRRTAELLREESRGGPTLDLSLAQQLALGGERPDLLRACWPTKPRVATFHEGYLGVMAHTEPTPRSDLPLPAFVSGPDERELDVLVAWRRSPALLASCDVLPGEQVSVPLPTLRAILGTKPDPTLADAEVWPGVAPEKDARAVGFEVYVRRDRSWVKVASADVRPGDEVVLGSLTGGYDPRIGVRSERTSPVPDCSIAAALAARDAWREGARRRRVLVALNRETLGDWWGDPAQADDGGQADDDGQVTGRAAFVRLVDRVIASPDLLGEEGTAQELAALAPEELGLDETSAVTIEGDALLVELTFGPRAGLADGDGAGGDRRARPQLLSHHSEQVRAVSEAAARAAGLHDDLVAQLALAGLWHDAGKLDPRFQAYLRGATFVPGGPGRPGGPGPERGALMSGEEPEPLAKSRRGVGSGTVERRYRARADLAERWRHEVESARRCAERGFPLLVTHLSGSSHGRGRPFWWGPEDQPESAAHAEAFQDLNQQYGPWGLAYLEAVLRLSDWLASASPLGYPGVTAQGIFGPGEPGEAGGVAGAARVTDVGAGGAGAVAKVGAADAGGVGATLVAVTEASLDGLDLTPLTGWFAVAGLLRTAYDAGDRTAAVWWPHAAGQSPAVPRWRSALALEEVCELLLGSEQWEAVERYGLRAKYQKLPAERVGGMLDAVARAEAGAERAWPWLATALVQDAQRADLKGNLEFTIAAKANNASYVDIALEARAVGSGSLVAGCLTDSGSGWLSAKCDGGMDRTSFDGGVTGREVKGSRIIRSGLAPAALTGMASMGTVGLDGLGVRRRQLALPLPAEPTTWPELVALTHAVRTFPGWCLDYRSETVGYELLWKGGVGVAPRAAR